MVNIPVLTAVDDWALADFGGNKSSLATVNDKEQ